MAPKASINPPKYSWGGGARTHSISEQQHQANVAALAAKKRAAAGTATTAPAGTPAPGTPGGPLALPVDATYLSQEESLRNQRDQAIAAQRQARDATLLGYGYSGTFDPTNDALTGGLTFDPNNPFSKAALLKKSYDVSRSSAAQTMGSRGGLYQGAFQNQQDLVNRGQLQAEDALQTSLVSWLANNAAAIGAARTAYETGVSSAQGEAADRAANLQNPNYQPTAPDNSTTAAPVVATPPKVTTSKPQPTTTKKKPKPRVVVHTNPHSVRTP